MNSEFTLWQNPFSLLELAAKEWTIIPSREAIFYGVLSRLFQHGLEKKAKKEGHVALWN